jgi:C1A family cysteine protease
MSGKHGGFGWKPDSPDDRDYQLAAPFAPEQLPAHVDLTPHMPGVYNQGQLGSCTANAIAALVEYQQHVQKEATGIPSRLFIYYCERVLEHSVNEDAGAEIRDGMKVVAKQGAPPEGDWPYHIAKFAVKPPAKAYADAVKHEALAYKRVTQTVQGVQGALAAGHPVVFGFSVYSSFESDEVAKTGIVPLPDVNNEELLGGHAVLAVGYDTASLTFRVRNSWGTGWGQHGYFTMPFNYLLDKSLASDLWTLTRET